MSAGRLRHAIQRLPCSCLRPAPYSSYSHSSSSDYASTSALTLDDPIPRFKDLLGTAGPLAQPEQKEGNATRGRKGPRAQRERSLLHHLDRSSSASTSAASTPRPARHPPNDRTQISPFLPLVTRERNYLLSLFRQSLNSHSSSSRKRPRLPPSAKHRWNPDSTWIALACILRYPEEVPDLPRSHFPSSTRSPRVDSDDPSSLPPCTGAFDPSFPARPSALEEPDGDPIGRRKIDLSLPELKRAFTIFSSSRPRTRTGLHRLLILAELLARRSRNRDAQMTFGLDVGGEGAGTELRGGGIGLKDKDWTQLILFVGANLRTTRPDPDAKSAVGLFSQREEQARKLGRRTSGGTDGQPGDGQSETTTRLYNALLHVAGRARMWELFEQVLQRMEETGVESDAATFVERMTKDVERGAPVNAVWRVFEEGLRSMLARGGNGAEREAEGLWAALMWVLAKKGRMDEAMRIYDAMRSGKETNLEDLRPASVAHSTSPVDLAYSPSPAPISPDLTVRLPPPDERIYSALVQSFSHRGDLRAALHILKDMLSPASRASPSTVVPQPQHFHHLFRAFVLYGEAPYRPKQHGLDLDYTVLSGARARAKTTKASERSALAVLGTRPGKEPASASDFTLSALSTLFTAFLDLSPPPPALIPTLPFYGARTAPAPKTLFFALKAFEKLTGGDSEVVVEVWERLERKFELEEEGWTGWRPGRRVERLVAGHRERVEERRRKREELEDF
ncbi:hypothetical protein JCM21900_006871 [Sporobolomyces salmonicolor]